MLQVEATGIKQPDQPTNQPTNQMNKNFTLINLKNEAFSKANV
jgi:hypothetical protein